MVEEEADVAAFANFTLDAAAAAPAAAAPAPAAAAPAPAAPAPAAPAPVAAAAPVATGDRVFASPKARKVSMSRWQSLLEAWK